MLNDTGKKVTLDTFLNEAKPGRTVTLPSMDLKSYVETHNALVEENKQLRLQLSRSKEEATLIRVTNLLEHFITGNKPAYYVTDGRQAIPATSLLETSDISKTDITVDVVVDAKELHLLLKNRDLQAYTSTSKTNEIKELKQVMAGLKNDLATLQDKLASYDTLTLETGALLSTKG